MSADLPSVRYTADSPGVEPAFVGVRLAAPASRPAGSPLVVHGVYVLPEKDAKRAEPTFHGSVVSVLTLGERYLVGNPFRDRVLFPDDEERNAWGRRGYFHFEALPGEATASGTYYVYVSIGEHLSNVVAITVS